MILTEIGIFPKKRKLFIIEELIDKQLFNSLLWRGIATNKKVIAGSIHVTANVSSLFFLIQNNNKQKLGIKKINKISNEYNNVILLSYIEVLKA